MDINRNARKAAFPQQAAEEAAEEALLPRKRRGRPPGQPTVKPPVERTEEQPTINAGEEKAAPLSPPRITRPAAFTRRG